jgi:ubiquinone/menaquinone biosynthesis C-methylase UbiE
MEMKTLFGAALLAAAALAWPARAFAQQAAPQDPAAMHALHRNSQAYVAMLDDPRRDAWQKPHEVIEALALEPGEVVADIGSGSGYFTLRLAAHVGEQGRVYAVDIDPEMVRHLNQRLRDAGVRNVFTVLAEPDDPLLPDASVDKVVIVDTWHHIANHASYLAKLERVLKPGGQIVMIDFKKQDLPVGPPLSMKIARADLVRQLAEAGFKLAAEHDFLPYQYFLVFTRPS